MNWESECHVIYVINHHRTRQLYLALAFLLLVSLFSYNILANFVLNVFALKKGLGGGKKKKKKRKKKRGRKEGMKREGGRKKVGRKGGMMKRKKRRKGKEEEKKEFF